MTPLKPSARSTAIVLCLGIAVAVLTGCKPSSTRPSIVPTPPSPPQVTCERTPPPSVVPKAPPLHSADDIPANDAWKATLIGLYEGEVSIRKAEHDCWASLRAKGVIR